MRANRFTLYVARRCIFVGLIALAIHSAGRRVEAQEFIAPLFPTEPTEINSWFWSNAHFNLRPDNTVNFVIRFGVENVFPDRALIFADKEEFPFDLGEGLVIIHSPGPWPNGYDGATQYKGSFLLADDFIDDFRMAQSTLRLEGSDFGDFSGSIVPVPEPSTAALVVIGIAAFGFFWHRRRKAKLA
jgi:hypothetical protein